MAKNKITTSQGNVQFTNAKGRTINMHPMHCYAVYEGDTVSFLFIYMKEYSGQAFFASQFEDLEVDGETYDSIDALKEAIAEAFAKAGAQARTEIVDELPETGYTNTIYLIKKEHGEGYDEYIYNEEKGWQLIGDTDIEFERYLQKVDFNAYSADTRGKIDFISGAVDDNASDIQFLSGAVDTEISNREAADAVISGAVDTLSANLSLEVQRAQNAEQTLQNNINTANARIDAEQIARANADNALSGAIDTVVSDLASEVSRATAKENEIDSKVDGEISNREAADTAISGAVDTLSANLSLEVQRAQNAESALNTKVNAISGAVDTMGDEAIVDAAYVSTSTTINFYNADGAVVAQVDATDFIKDGMIEDVRIENGYLIIDFNTASGKQDISIPLTDIFNPANYYDKTAVDGLLANKANSADVYTRSETDGKLADKADLSALTEDERVWGEALNDLNSRINTVSGDVTSLGSDKLNVSDFNTYSGSVESALEGKVNVSDFETFSGAVETALGNKFDASGITAYSTSQEVTAEIEAAVSGKAENSDLVALSGEVATLSGNAITSGDVQNQIDEAVSGKQDTLIAGENITIVDNVISAEGGGKAISAGTNISVTTGETADTINCTLPITAGTGTNSLILGYYNSGDSSWNSKASGEGSIACGVKCTASGVESIAIGYSNTASGGFNSGNFAQGYMTTASGNRCHSEGLGTSSTADASHSEGHNTTASGDYSHSEGEEVKATNVAEHSQGRYNVSNKANTTWGDSGNTLFSVGNGTAENARHNAFEIRQNGDIYFEKGGSDVKLQDVIPSTTSAVTENSTAVVESGGVYRQMGGLKLEKITQSAYDALVQAGTVDANTLYIISD